MMSQRRRMLMAANQTPLTLIGRCLKNKVENIYADPNTPAMKSAFLNYDCIFSCSTSGYISNIRTTNNGSSGNTLRFTVNSGGAYYGPTLKALTGNLAGKTYRITCPQRVGALYVGADGTLLSAVWVMASVIGGTTQFTIPNNNDIRYVFLSIQGNANSNVECDVLELSEV